MSDKHNRPVGGPINRIVVGSGDRRVAVEIPRDRDTRYDLGKRIKQALFPTHQAFKAAKARGERAASPFRGKVAFA